MKTEHHNPEARLKALRQTVSEAVRTVEAIAQGIDEAYDTFSNQPGSGNDQARSKTPAFMGPRLHAQLAEAPRGPFLGTNADLNILRQGLVWAKHAVSEQRFMESNDLEFYFLCLGRARLVTLIDLWTQLDSVLKMLPKPTQDRLNGLVEAVRALNETALEFEGELYAHRVEPELNGGIEPKPVPLEVGMTFDRIVPPRIIRVAHGEPPEMRLGKVVAKTATHLTVIGPVLDSAGQWVPGYIELDRLEVQERNRDLIPGDTFRDRYGQTVIVTGIDSAGELVGRVDSHILNSDALTERLYDGLAEPQQGTKWSARRVADLVGRTATDQPIRVAGPGAETRNQDGDAIPLRFENGSVSGAVLCTSGPTYRHGRVLAEGGVNKDAAVLCGFPSTDGGEIVGGVVVDEDGSPVTYDGAVSGLVATHGEQALERISQGESPEKVFQTMVESANTAALGFKTQESQTKAGAARAKMGVFAIQYDTAHVCTVGDVVAFVMDRDGGLKMALHDPDPSVDEIGGQGPARSRPHTLAEDVAPDALERVWPTLAETHATAWIGADDEELRYRYFRCENLQPGDTIVLASRALLHACRNLQRPGNDGKGVRAGLDYILETAFPAYLTSVGGQGAEGAELMAHLYDFVMEQARRGEALPFNTTLVGATKR